MARPTPTWLFAQIFGIGDVKEWSLDYWYKGPGGSVPMGFDPNQLANDFFVMTGFQAAIAAIMNSSYNILGSRVEVNFSTGTFGGIYYQTVPGVLTNQGMPEDVCAVVRKNTSTGGRSYTGVNRYSALDNSLVTGSYLNATGIAAMAAIKSATIATFTSQTVTYTPQVYSKKLNVLTAISGISLLNKLGTVRRRRPRF